MPPSGTPHLDDALVARHLDGASDAAERDRVAGHLADCPACRRELGELRAALRAVPRRGVPLVPVLATAAALVLVVWGTSLDRTPGPVTRDEALTEALAPAPRVPIGAVSGVDSLRWTSVPVAAHYRLTLFNAEGQALWQATQSDTVVALPTSLLLLPGATYYWQVKAETGYGRWVESELVSFTVAEPPPTP